ncbi:MAG: hypothetical protein K0Q74_482 [Gammaproteobacteria bacterium]|jgi:hypothetical protein|nr:hypothetical protein [Gammaproteobacteria bacterium]
MFEQIISARRKMSTESVTTGTSTTRKMSTESATRKMSIESDFSRCSSEPFSLPGSPVPLSSPPSIGSISSEEGRERAMSTEADDQDTIVSNVSRFGGPTEDDRRISGKRYDLKQLLISVCQPGDLRDFDATKFFERYVIPILLLKGGKSNPIRYQPQLFIGSIAKQRQKEELTKEVERDIECRLKFRQAREGLYKKLIQDKGTQELAQKLNDIDIYTWSDIAGEEGYEELYKLVREECAGDEIRPLFIQDCLNYLERHYSEDSEAYKFIHWYANQLSELGFHVFGEEKAMSEASFKYEYDPTIEEINIDSKEKIQTIVDHYLHVHPDQLERTKAHRLEITSVKPSEEQKFQVINHHLLIIRYDGQNYTLGFCDPKTKQYHEELLDKENHQAIIENLEKSQKEGLDILSNQVLLTQLNSLIRIKTLKEATFTFLETIRYLMREIPVFLLFSEKELHFNAVVCRDQKPRPWLLSMRAMWKKYGLMTGEGVLTMKHDRNAAKATRQARRKARLEARKEGNHPDVTVIPKIAPNNKEKARAPEIKEISETKKEAAQQGLDEFLLPGPVISLPGPNKSSTFFNITQKHTNAPTEPPNSDNPQVKPRSPLRLPEVQKELRDAGEELRDAGASLIALAENAKDYSSASNVENEKNEENEEEKKRALEQKLARLMSQLQKLASSLNQPSTEPETKNQNTHQHYGGSNPSRLFHQPVLPQLPKLPAARSGSSLSTPLPHSHQQNTAVA